uniref:Nucleoporin Nup120/160 beta-propeller domain-containing protein n=1 Tax=Octopus bimaculoides TaxID=37653 RepID=A0A0L8GFP7_OCTBM
MAHFLACRNLLFREVAKTQTAAPVWKEITVNTGGSDSTLQDIKVSNTSGGYAYQDSTQPNSAASNRFIYWRTTGDILELVEQSLDYNLIGSHVRYRFQDTPLLGGTSVHEHQGKVYILVTTVASVHRLVFPHPNKIPKPETVCYRFGEDSKALSIFADASLTSAQDSRNFHMVNPGGSLTSQLYCAATCLDSDGQAMFAFSTSLGSILLFCMPTIDKPGEVTRFELCHSSMMQRIWSGLVPNIIKGSSETAEKALSLVMDAVDDEVFIFCVCKDHKLRWWSTKTQECLMVFNLLDLTRNKQHPHLPSIGGKRIPHFRFFKDFSVLYG